MQCSWVGLVNWVYCRLEAITNGGNPMAVETRRRTYPAIPAKVWWELRRRFQRTKPGQVTPNYLQTVLSIQEGHARNLIPQLKAASLIDDDGKPTVLANGWRTDEGYSDACRRIVDTTYS